MFVTRLLAILAYALLTPPVYAFNLTGNTWPESTTEFHVGMTGADGLWNRSFEDAMAIWNGSTDFEYRIFRNDFRNPCVRSGEFGFPANGVKFSATACDEIWGETTIAITIPWVDLFNPNQLAQTGIVFNSNESWNVYSGPLRLGTWLGINDFQRVAIHELGHALELYIAT